MTCGLCGHTYDENAQGCRPSCPLSRGCNLVCCPNCGLRKLLVKLSSPRRNP